MYYTLSKEEYDNLVSKSILEKYKKKVENLNDKVLELYNGGVCLASRGGYCDDCPLFKLNTCEKYKNISK